MAIVSYSREASKDEMAREIDRRGRAIAQLEEFIGRREDDVLEIARQREEAQSHAQAWHRVCETIATVLGLPLPDADFANVVRNWSEAREARIAALEDAVRVKDEALVVFAEFAQWTDAEGWTCNIHREGISVWFGPSDFRRARTALAKGQNALVSGREDGE